jgi:hypothetical protein
MRALPIPPNTSLSFADYFRLNLATEDVAQHFGYSYASAVMSLPRSASAIPWMADLHERLTQSLPFVSLTSEAARREFLIAPILIDLARYVQVKVRIEYPLKVTEQLQGTLDYYLQAEQQLLVIEAKNADLERGFTQLAAELIALDLWTDAPVPLLYGAVSIGNVWQFGMLARETKHITQDLNLFRVPTDLEELLRILLAVLAPE